MHKLRAHTRQQRLVEDALVVSEESFADFDPDKLGTKITPMPNGCWAYRRDLDRYHVVKTSRGSMNVHRYIYGILREPVADGLDLHHECLNPGCVNPDHLTPLTRAEHMAWHRDLGS